MTDREKYETSREIDRTIYFIYSPICGFGAYEIKTLDGKIEFYNQELATLYGSLSRLGIERFDLPRCMASLKSSLTNTREMRRVIVASDRKFDRESGKLVDVIPILRNETGEGTDIFLLKGYSTNGTTQFILNPLDSKDFFELSLEELLSPRRDHNQKI